MIPWDYFASPLAERLTGVLLHFTWQALAVAAALLLVVRLFRIREAQARHAASLLALIALASLPCLTWLWLGNSLAPAVHDESLSFKPQLAAEIESTASSLAPWRSYFLAAWFCGVIAFSIRLATSATSVLWLRVVSRPLPTAWRKRFEPVLAGLNASSQNLVRISEYVTEAVAVGLVRPMVLLPASWLTELPPDVLRAVLAHELAHLRRGDLWVTLLQRVLETLFFYHPVVWWLSRRISEEREICCDELAAAVVGDPVAYAQALEQAARQQLAGASPSLAACIFGGDSMSLLKRVRHLLGVGDVPHPVRQPLGLFAMAASLLLGLAVAGFSNGPRGAIADDEREGARDKARRESAEVKDFVQRGEERKDADPQAARRDGDRPAAERRDADRRDGDRRDGDRPAAERRDGDRRDGDRAAAERREGDRPDGRREGDRPDGRREGDRPDAARRERAEGDRRNIESQELASLVQELRAEVRQLRAQVAELQQRVTQRKGEVVEGIKEGAADARREAAGRKEQLLREMKEQIVREREAAAAKLGEKVRKEGDREVRDYDGAKPGEKRPEVRKEGERRDEKPRKEEVNKSDYKREGDKPLIKKEGDQPAGNKEEVKKPDYRKEGDKPAVKKVTDEPPAKKEVDKSAPDKNAEKPTPKKEVAEDETKRPEEKK